MGGNGAVHLWRVALDGPFDPGVLSPDETGRAERFSVPMLRNRYCAGRCALREILSGYLHASPQSIEFKYNEHGKPLLDGMIDFNLSHAGDRMLLGVTHGISVGVDLETRGRHVDSAAIATRFFSALEVERYHAFPIHERNAAFLRGWVRKEAYVKAIGTGIAGGLKTFSVSLADCMVTAGPDGWTFYDVAMGPEFIASAALTSNQCELQLYDYQSPLTFHPAL